MAIIGSWTALDLADIVPAGQTRVAVYLSARDHANVVDNFIISSLPTRGQLFASAAGDTAIKAGNHIAVANGSATLYFQPEAGFTERRRSVIARRTIR